MNKLLTLSSFSVLALLFANCNRCQSCQFEYEVNDSTYYYHSGSYCGNKIEMDDFKEECNENASMYGVEAEFVDE